jgi:hypothetical protein
MSNQIETTITVQYENRDRSAVALRIFLVIPIAIFAAAFATWSTSQDSSTWVPGLILIPTVLALLFRGIYPSYVLEFNKALLSLSTRINSYVFLLTDKYPTIEENDSTSITFPEIDGGAKLNRYLPLAKWLLALPLYLVGALYTVYALVMLVIAWFTILFTGSMPVSNADVLVRTIQFWNRVYGYALLLVTDEYPSFSL